MEYSVIIPTFNSEKYLVETLNSVLRQTIRPKEIIICDNGSTDKTIEMAESLTKPVIFTTESEKGPGPARNKAASLATTELIAFLDSGDVWHPEKMEMQLPLMKEADLSYCYSSFIYPSGTFSCRQKPVDSSRAEILYYNNYIVSSTVVMKRDVFYKLGGFDPSFRVTEDWDLWLRVARNYKIQCCPFELVTQKSINEVTTEFLTNYRGVSQTLDKNNHLVKPGTAFKVKMGFLGRFIKMAIKHNQYRQALSMIFG